MAYRTLNCDLGPIQYFSESIKSKYGFLAGDNSLPAGDSGISKGNLELPMSDEKCTVWAIAKGISKATKGLCRIFWRLQSVI